MEVFKLKKYDLDDVKRLIELANKNDLSVLEIETKKGRRIRIEKNKPVAPAVAFNATAPTPAPAPVQAPVVETAPVQQSAPTQASASKPSGKTIKAPMVGVFYQAASPEADPYVTVGKTVKKGDTVCIIEAMKLMNEIQAEEDGTIKEILVKNGDIIEYGQPLFVIE